MTEASAPEASVETPPEESVGEALTRARTALGLSIEECAQQLKFSVKKIEALEQGRYDELPGGTFARGMLRSYARLLNLDPGSLVARVADRVHVPDTTTTAVSLRQPIPFSEPGKRGNLVYVLLSVTALAVVGWVAWGWQQERSGTTKLSFVSAAKPPAQKREDAVVAAVTPSITAIQQERVEPPQPEPKAEEKAPVAATATTTVPASGKRRIVLSFARESWVEVRDRANRVLLSQMNAPGSEKVVEGEPPFTLVIGNAQHVRVTYDDRPVELAPHVKVDVARLSLE